MRVAVVGCLHGSLSELYRTLPPDIDLVLCCGDFQAFRNEIDINSAHIPAKHRELGSFHKYYSQPRDIPLTIVVGGNHEASNYFGELFYGGWIAHNIYYLGVAGSVIVNGLRIAGASGIYKKPSFGLGHYERVPLDRKSLNTAYHIRRWNEERLSFVSAPKEGGGANASSHLLTSSSPTTGRSTSPTMATAKG
jgi:lariat debranching enzyme